MTIANTDKDLSSMVDRLVRCEEIRIAAAEDVKQLKKEAKDSGYDIKTIAQLAKFKMDEAALDKFRKDQNMLEVYANDIGMDLFDYAGRQGNK